MIKSSFVAALGMTASLSGALSAQCPDGTPPPCGARTVARAAAAIPAAAERARRFLILPFRNVTRQADQEWLIEGSTTMLADVLGRWQGINVVPDEKLYPALKRAGISPGAIAEQPRVRRVAEETGGWTAVTGEVLATGGRLRITARAWDVPTNRELVRASSEIPTTGDVRLAFDSVGLKLLRSAGVDSVTSDLAASTTRDLDAYRAYLRGLAHERRSEVKSAITALSEAVRRDSSFALAWARLAHMSIAADPAALVNPLSPAHQYSQRAVSLAGHLPPRQRDLVLAMGADFSAQFAEARRLLESLVARDSNDVDAVVALASIEAFDPVLIPVPGGQRPRGSPNRVALLAKRAVQLDPSRHSLFLLLVSVYKSAGVPGTMPVIGLGRAPTSYVDLMTMLTRSQNVTIYTPLLRDTILLVPAESLSAIPKDTLRELRRQARAVARSWAERWLAVAPDEAAAHQTISELYALDGEYAAALRELAAAESLGVQQPAWSAATYRLKYLAKSGDVAAAGRIADSLTAAGFWGMPANIVGSTEAGPWAFGLQVARGRVANADAIVQQAIALRRMFAADPLPAFRAILILMGNEDPADEPGISRDFRRREVDTVLAHIEDFAATPLLGPWLPYMLPALVEIADTTKRRARDVLTAAATLASKGKQTLAFQLAVNAVAMDTSLERDAAAFPWYRSAAETLNAQRQARMSRFRPGSATITAQQAVFEWRVNDSTGFARNLLESPPGVSEYRWDVTIEGAQRYVRLILGSNPKAAADAPASVPLTELVNPSVGRGVAVGALNSAGVMTDTTRAQNVTFRTEVVPGALRFILSDPALISRLRAERPNRARFRFAPCLRPIGQPGEPRCVDERIPIEYKD